MSDHRATVSWTRTSVNFEYESYNRAHEVIFKDGAIALPASAASAFRGNAERVDPEEAFVASLASCHLLTFLAICARKRLALESYEDNAVGFLEKGLAGKLWMARVILHPLARFAAAAGVDGSALAQLHHLAHRECFIANSVRTDVTVMPRL